MNINTSINLFEKANKYIPGGVNSPVRAFKSVGGNPIFIKSATGAYLTDEDENKYIDLINSWGPMILGHANDKIVSAVNHAVKESLSFGAPGIREVQIAELICTMVPSIEKVRMVNSGTEATMSAIRLARGFTGKDKILKFEGCYHGHADSFLIAAGSGVATFGQPDSPGVTKGTALDTLTAPFNDLKAVENIVDQNKNQIAAIILEPVAGNMGLVLPIKGFLDGLRKLCDNNGILLIFDEVMTGFRLAKAGAQELFNVTPDLTTLGKIIGGGMPVGCYGGKKEIMDYISPSGPVYQAGTLSGNPVAMAAGLAMLSELNSNLQFYNLLNNTSSQIAKGIAQLIEKYKINAHVVQLGSMMCVYFQHEKVENFNDAKKSDTNLFKQFFHEMLSNGVYLPPSQYESWFISSAIKQNEINQILHATENAFSKMVMNK